MGLNLTRSPEDCNTPKSSHRNPRLPTELLMNLLTRERPRHPVIVSSLFECGVPQGLALVTEWRTLDLANKRRPNELRTRPYVLYRRLWWPGSKPNTFEGLWLPMRLKPTSISLKRAVSGHPMLPAIFFNNSSLLGAKTLFTSGSRLSL